MAFHASLVQAIAYHAIALALVRFRADLVVGVRAEALLVTEFGRSQDVELIAHDFADFELEINQALVLAAVVEAALTGGASRGLDQGSTLTNGLAVLLLQVVVEVGIAELILDLVVAEAMLGAALLRRIADGVLAEHLQDRRVEELRLAKSFECGEERAVDIASPASCVPHISEIIFDAFQDIATMLGAGRAHIGEALLDSRRVARALLRAVLRSGDYP